MPFESFMTSYSRQMAVGCVKSRQLYNWCQNGSRSLPAQHKHSLNHFETLLQIVVDEYILMPLKTDDKLNLFRVYPLANEFHGRVNFIRTYGASSPEQRTLRPSF